MSDISFDSIPSCVSDIYSDQIDKLALKCTPLSMNGIHLLTQEALNVLNKCNGNISVGKIIKLMGFNQARGIGIINSLWQSRLIKINREFPVEVETGANVKKKIKQIDVWFHITNKCNLSCPYCYIIKSNEDMSQKIAYSAIDNLAKSALSHNMKDHFRELIVPHFIF